MVYFFKKGIVIGNSVGPTLGCGQVGCLIDEQIEVTQATGNLNLCLLVS